MRRIAAWAGALFVHLALFLGITPALVHQPTTTPTRVVTADVLQLRFGETHLPAATYSGMTTARDAPSFRSHARVTLPKIQKARPAGLVPAPTGRTSAPASGPAHTTPYRSDHGDFGAGDQADGKGAASDTSQAFPESDAKVMDHGMGGITYRATRFDGSWVPDRENAVSSAIERATIHSSIKLPFGINLDCASGPSATGPTGTSVPTIALASTQCHGARPPAPAAAKAVLVSRGYRQGNLWWSASRPH